MSSRLAIVSILTVLLATPVVARENNDDPWYGGRPINPPRPPQPAVPAGPPTMVPPGGAATTAPKPAPIVAAPPKPAGPAPYEADIQRLGEILGALHYLRPLCGAADGPVWREKMQAIMDSEGGPTDRKERFAGAFNNGYSSFQTTYRTCTPAAGVAVNRYLTEGAKLSRDIVTRYGN
jgi:uncharacterized protein (TIGR02301 family)